MNSRSFNPRPYVRGDSRNKSFKGKILCGFNPRPYVRGDPEVLLAVLIDWMFQSAPLREGRY